MSLAASSSAPCSRFVGLDPGATGIFAAQKLSVFALVIGSFAGIGIATATGSHIVPRFAHGLGAGRMGAGDDRLADVLTGLFLIGVAWFGFKFVGSSFKTDLRAPVLDWPVWPVQLVHPAGVPVGGRALPRSMPSGRRSSRSRRSSRNDGDDIGAGADRLGPGLLACASRCWWCCLRPPRCVHLLWGRGNLEDIVEDMWVGLDKEVILSIPLFILCGNVMTRGSIAQRLIRILSTLTKPMPGGLAVATILSCAVFAAISGSSIVTMLAIGAVMYPAMRQAGYDNKFSLGAIMSGGTLGIIIPPSIPMIIYGLVTETSVTDLFAAGFGPGLLITFVLSAYSVWFNWNMPTARFDWAEFRVAFREGIWAAMMPVILLGGIYSGYFTATEAAAVALAYSAAGGDPRPQGAQARRLLRRRARGLQARRLAVPR